ncbi:uncharacterized protein [Miscanthus floridulus]|uniref:uncharacterized protein n=1 Tax=Miscanthus floridulus TaxID=154761 RepID=UPI0034576359
MNLLSQRRSLSSSGTAPSSGPNPTSSPRDRHDLAPPAPAAVATLAPLPLSPSLPMWRRSGRPKTLPPPRAAYGRSSRTRTPPPPCVRVRRRSEECGGAGWFVGSRGRTTTLCACAVACPLLPAQPLRRYAVACPPPRGPAQPSAHGSARLHSPRSGVPQPVRNSPSPPPSSLQRRRLGLCRSAPNPTKRRHASAPAAPVPSGSRVPGSGRRVCSSYAAFLHAARRPAESWSTASVPRPLRALLCSAASLMMSP